MTQNDPSVCKLLSICRLISHFKIHYKPCFILLDWQFRRARKILLVILKTKSATPEQKTIRGTITFWSMQCQTGTCWFSYGYMSWFYALRKRIIWYWIYIACRFIFCYDKMYTIISFVILKMHDMKMEMGSRYIWILIKNFLQT